MPDMFGTSHTVIAGRARIGDAVISYTPNAGTSTNIPAMNTQIAYSEEIQPQPLPGGEVFLTAQQPMGQITIGALLHSDYLALLDSFGSMDSLVESGSINALDLNVDSGVYTEETATGTTGEMITNTTISATGIKVTKFGMKLDIQNVLLQTNVQLFALNIDKPVDSDATT